jgi:hypothetical protein
VSQVSFNYHNFADPVTVTLSAIDDDEDKGFPNYFVLLTNVSSLDSMSSCQFAGRSNCARAVTYSTVLASSLIVSVVEDDVAGVSVLVIANATFDNYGNPLQSATYTLSLTSRPISAVTLTLSGFSGWSTANHSRVTFAPDDWNSRFVISLSAVCDSYHKTHSELLPILN